MADNLWVGAVRRGLAANKPTVPDVPSDTIGLYLEVDTGVMSVSSTTATTGSMAWATLGAVGPASVTAPATSDTIANSGTSTFSATAAKAYSLAAPAPNVTKTLTSLTTSSASKTITLASGNIVSTAASTIQTIVFNAIGQTLRLIGLSTSQYAVVSNNGAVTLS